MSRQVIQVLLSEIKVLQKSISGIRRRQSDLQKSYGEQIGSVEVEVKQLLARSGILNEHEALLSKKLGVRKEMQAHLDSMDADISLQNSVIQYFSVRIEALVSELEEQEASSE